MLLSPNQVSDPTVLHEAASYVRARSEEERPHSFLSYMMFAMSEEPHWSVAEAEELPGEARQDAAMLLLAESPHRVLVDDLSPGLSAEERLYAAYRPEMDGMQISPAPNERHSTYRTLEQSNEALARFCADILPLNERFKAAHRQIADLKLVPPYGITDIMAGLDIGFMQAHVQGVQEISRQFSDISRLELHPFRSMPTILGDTYNFSSGIKPLLPEGFAQTISQITRMHADIRLSHASLLDSLSTHSLLGDRQALSFSFPWEHQHYPSFAPSRPTERTPAELDREPEGLSDDDPAAVQELLRLIEERPELGSLILAFVLGRGDRPESLMRFLQRKSSIFVPATPEQGLVLPARAAAVTTPHGELIVHARLRFNTVWQSAFPTSRPPLQVGEVVAVALCREIKTTTELEHMIGTLAVTAYDGGLDQKVFDSVLPREGKEGTLKHLERILYQRVGLAADKAHALLSPFHTISNLRNGGLPAHLPNENGRKAFDSIGHPVPVQDPAACWHTIVMRYVAGLDAISVELQAMAPRA